MFQLEVHRECTVLFTFVVWISLKYMYICMHEREQYTYIWCSFKYGKVSLKVFIKFKNGGNITAPVHDKTKWVGFICKTPHMRIPYRVLVPLVYALHSLLISPSPVAVVRSWPHRQDSFVKVPLVAFHYQLMSTADEINIISTVELHRIYKNLWTEDKNSCLIYTKIINFLKYSKDIPSN